MSVLAALRDRETAARPRRSIAIFADPVFDRTDARLRAATADAVTVPAIAGPAPPPGPSLTGSLPRLPGTRAEARSVAALVADEEPLVALGFEASRGRVMGRDLGDYRILHFATHGKVDRKSPALSALVLSRFDPEGRPLDGYLRLHDIYRLNINADLVVLSACETGLGTDINGEGLVGLAQGFLYAGARSLLISLWSVPDRATYQLMTRFYGHLIEDGLRPAAALRRAQLSMASERRWRDPYFWGAFILLGDWA
jgi:CHAT domain-containing protein